MNTLFDIGEEVNLTLKGKVIGYSASLSSGDCYTIEISDTRNNNLRVYLDTDSLKHMTRSEKDEKA